MSSTQRYSIIIFICLGLVYLIFMVAYYKINGTLSSPGGEYIIADKDLDNYPLLKYPLFTLFGGAFLAGILSILTLVRTKVKAMAEVITDAKEGGHDITIEDAVEEKDGTSEGHVVRCRKCGQSALVDQTGLQYNLLDVICPGEK